MENKKIPFRKRFLQEILNNPETTQTQLAKKLNVSKSQIGQTIRTYEARGIVRYVRSFAIDKEKAKKIILD